MTANISPAEEPTAFTFNPAPGRQCDLVMKGGITSGVVYPPAVLQLQETFRFRAIGGTSAGAIAAAVTASAEFDREGGGFRRLDELRKRLAEPGFLLNLFKPTPATAPAFGVLTDLFLSSVPDEGKADPRPKPRSWRRAMSFAIRAGRSLARHFPAATARGRLGGGLVGALPAGLIFLGIALADSLSETFSRPWIAAPFALFAVAGMAIGALCAGFISGVRGFVQIFTGHLPRDGYFGLCIGHNGDGDSSILTDWLAAQIDQLAGKSETDDPLTFADLARKRGTSADPADITLRMVTTNLSHGQPYVFPREGDIFLFKEDDMSRFFPRRIVDYLKKAGSSRNLPLPEGYLFLPRGDKLPVIFATRLSLSFPILLSALRLYTIKPAAFAEFRRCKKDGLPFTFEPETHFQENWFSDGGICSNFPIHFFDSWLPSRPTFGINLSDIPDDGKAPDDTIKSDNFSAGSSDLDAVADGDLAEAASDPDEPLDVNDVNLPHPREGGRGMAQWSPVAGLPGFVVSMFDTARNYRDTMQAMLPSYRERVVQVRLTSEEGGLNLAMEPKAIRRIGAKGRKAGELLTSMDFHQHQWVRLRVLMAYLEKGIHRMRENFPEVKRYQDLFDLQLEAHRDGARRGGRWYKPASRSWCEKAITRLNAIVELGNGWQPEFFGQDPPRPEATLRVTPPL